MEKKVITFLILLNLAIYPIFSQNDKPTITVLDFEIENVAAVEMSTFVNSLTSALFQTYKYKVIDTKQRELVLNELQFSASGCSDESCLLEIGKMLSAEIILIGSISRIESRYYVTAKLLETETAELLSITDDVFESGSEMINNAGLVVSELTNESQDAEIPDKPSLPSEPLSPETLWGISSLSAGIVSAAAGIYFLNHLRSTSVEYNGSVVDYVQADDSADFTALNEAMNNTYNSSLLDLLLGEGLVITGSALSVLGGQLLLSESEQAVRRGFGWGTLGVSLVSIGAGIWVLIDSLPDFLSFSEAIDTYTAAGSEVDRTTLTADLAAAENTLADGSAYGRFSLGTGLVTAGIGFGIWSVLLFFTEPISLSKPDEQKIPLSFYITHESLTLLCSFQK